MGRILSLAIRCNELIKRAAIYDGYRRLTEGTFRKRVWGLVTLLKRGARPAAWRGRA